MFDEKKEVRMKVRMNDWRKDVMNLNRNGFIVLKAAVGQRCRTMSSVFSVF